MADENTRRLQTRASRARQKRTLKKFSLQSLVDKHVDDLVSEIHEQDKDDDDDDEPSMKKPTLLDYDCNDGHAVEYDRDFDVEGGSCALQSTSGIKTIPSSYHESQEDCECVGDVINDSNVLSENRLKDQTVMHGKDRCVGTVRNQEDQAIPLEEASASKIQSALSYTVAENSDVSCDSSDDGLFTDLEDYGLEYLSNHSQLGSSNPPHTAGETDSTLSVSQSGSTSLPVNDANQLSDDSIILEETEENPEKMLQSSLAQWAVKYHIRSNALSDLLRILQDHGHSSLPKSSKTLLHTPRSTTHMIRNFEGGGKFWYFGILKSMSNRLTLPYLKSIKDLRIVIDVFTDGLSPYRSTGTQLGPIAGRLKNQHTPFLIAMWCGDTTEPKNVHAFWEDFLCEAGDLMEGFELHGSFYKLEIRKYMGDGPARSWFLQVNPHNSTICCQRCTVLGHYCEHRMTYDPSDVAALRTDESFLNQDQKGYHKGLSPLLKLQTKMVTQVPLDTMHLLYLGVMKRILVRLLRKRKSTYTLRKQEIEEVYRISLLVLKYLPSDFKTKRGLQEMPYTKAKEFRRISMYDGFLLFKLLPHPELFENFLLFACALRILANPLLVPEYVDDAEKLLNAFVKSCQHVYGSAFIVYNVHHLQHLADDCRRHGTLEEISCFPYENYLGKIKDLLYAPGRTLSQIVCRVTERMATLPDEEPAPKPAVSFEQEHFSGPTLDCNGQQFKKLETPYYMLQLSGNNCYCLTTAGEVVWVQNIIKSNVGGFVIGQRFSSLTNYFEKPIPSGFLNIYKVQGLKPLQKWPLGSIKTKIVLLPLKPKANVNWNSDEGLCLPMLHHTES